MLFGRPTGSAMAETPANPAVPVTAGQATAQNVPIAIVTSSQIDSISQAIAQGSPRGTIWLVTPNVQVDIGLAAACDLAVRRGVSMLGVRSTMLNEPVVRTVRAAGLGISAWACNDEATIARILALGVDSMTTDRPDLALRAAAAH